MNNDVAVDALAGLLDGPRAHGAFLLRAILDAPWGIRIEDEVPLTVVAVARGSAWVLRDGESRADWAPATWPSSGVLTTTRWRTTRRRRRTWWSSPVRTARAPRTAAAWPASGTSAYGRGAPARTAAP